MEHAYTLAPLAQCPSAEEAFSEFLHLVSHDLSAPLRESTSFAQLLQEKYGKGLDAKAQNYLTHVLAGSRRAQAMLDGLLAYSRLDTRAGLFCDAVDTPYALTQAMDHVRADIVATGAEIHVECLPFVRADRAQLSLLFECLLSNSLKFVAPLQVPRITISGSSIGKGWRFVVRDNGIGIAPRDYEEIFRPLRQLHAVGSYPGVGMGLALARRICARHGGKIWVESEPGKGASFWFTLAHRHGAAQEMLCIS
jgi:light-regulated signal transduction histidine kinase (bacteriophytochrome)